MNGSHTLRLSNIGMFLKPYKVIDHYPPYEQFSSAFRLKTTLDQRFHRAQNAVRRDERAKAGEEEEPLVCSAIIV